MKDDDFMEHFYIARTFDYLIFFYKSRTMLCSIHIHSTGRLKNFKGKALVNFLNLNENERVTAMIPIGSTEDGSGENDDDLFITMVTRNGLIKKSRLSEYRSATRENGILAIRFASEEDEVVSVKLSDNTAGFGDGNTLWKGY